MKSPIQIATWANTDDDGKIDVPSGIRPVRMCGSDGTGQALVKDGTFGADVIHFQPASGVTTHTHDGAHILFVIKGTGYVEYEGEGHALKPGSCYLIPSMVKHAIRATEELVLIAVGNDHSPLDSKERLTLD